jgi:hypothetical protein
MVDVPAGAAMEKPAPWHLFRKRAQISDDGCASQAIPSLSQKKLISLS